MFVALALVSLSSCKDFLDKVPDTRVYLTNLDQLEELLVTGYSYANYSLLGELSSDNMVDNNSPDADGMRYNLSYYSQFDNQVYAWEDVDLDISSTDSPSGVWGGCYSAIAAANAVFEKLDEIEETGLIDGEAITSTDRARINAIKGEAYMIRAYHHFILASLFCMPYRGASLSQSLKGIPYTTTPEKEVSPQYDRGTLQETYDKIEADLKQGLRYITDEYYEVPKYHFNKASSYAFAARFYLNKREYDKVVAYCDSTFKGNDPATMMQDIWDHIDFYYFSDVYRFYNSIERASNLMLFTTYSTFDRRFWGSRYACNRDAKRATVQGPGPSWANCIYQYTSGSKKTKFAMMPCFAYFCGSAGQEYGAFFGGTCYEAFEYTDKIAGIGYVHMIRPEFTVEETLLMRAEANLFLGNKEAAFDDLYLWNHAHILSDASRVYNHKELTENQILSFYGCYDDPERTDPGYGIVMKFHIDEVCPSDKYKLTDDIEPYLQCVQHFRRIQNVHLGTRWLDIKRFGFSITHKIGISDTKTLEVLDPRYAIQIPDEVIGAGLEANERASITTNSSSASVVSPSKYDRADEDDE